MKILIVDDNLDLANGLHEILSIDHHDAHVFYNAEEALHACQNENFDIAFIDVKLPNMNGIELYTHINRISPATHLFIISGYRITQIIEESTGISNTAILHENPNDYEISQFVEKLDTTPLTLALANTNDYIVRLSEQLVNAGKKPLITSKQQLASHNIEDYDVLILHTPYSLIHGLTNFIEIKQMGNRIPTVLISELSLSDNTHNKLHSLQLTGCIFKPFVLDEIINIVNRLEDSTADKKITANLTS